MNYQEFIVVVALMKDIVLTAGALTTIGLGIYGLRIWKRDLVGKEVYAVVKDLVRNLHKVSRECRKLRSPAHASEKRMMGADERQQFTDNERWRLLEAEVYSKRLEILVKAMDALDDCILNARVLIGSSVYMTVLPFQKKVRECIERVNDYTDLLYDHILNLAEDSAPIASAQQALYPTEELDDPLTQDVMNRREDAELELLRFLHRKSIRGSVSRRLSNIGY